jgi:hypothetical protein
VTPYEQKKRAFRDGTVFQPSAAAHLFEPSRALHALSGPGDRDRFERMAKMMTTISLRGRISPAARNAIIAAVDPRKLPCPPA